MAGGEHPGGKNGYGRPATAALDFEPVPVALLVSLSFKVSTEKYLVFGEAGVCVCVCVCMHMPQAAVNILVI